MVFRTRSWRAAILGAAAGGCLALPLDLVGVDEIVVDKEELQAPEAITDDRIEDKHPEYDPTLTIEEEFGGCKITLNKSGSVTKLDSRPFDETDSGFSGRIFPGRAAALAALGVRDVLPSMEVVNGALKPFNDGLYAAVELAAEGGSDGALVAKKRIFEDLLTALVGRASSGTTAERPHARDAAVRLAAAVRLGGGVPSAPPDVVADGDAIAAEFESDPLASRPIGFYTWTPELGAVFRRDRFLQSPRSTRPGFGAFAAAAVALNGAPELSGRYGKVLDLYSGLTNPFFHLSLRDLQPLAPDAQSLADVPSLFASFSAAHPETGGTEECAAHLAFVPASDSPETRLFRNLFCDTGLPSDNLIDVLISRIRSGQIDLTPTATSGFYDRQLHALETLLVPDRAPEKDHLFLTKRYKEKLVETFKSIITQNRETHVKQLEIGGSDELSAPSEPIDVYPKLPVEPFPTFYLRSARAYRFLEGVLQAIMGTEFLAKATRVVEDGSRSPVPLGSELREKTALLYGLHVLSSASIGMRHSLDADEAAAFDPAQTAEAAREWLLRWQSDPDVMRDPRVIVPVHEDRDLAIVRHWAVVGVKVLRLQASFYPGYEPEVVSGYCEVRGFIDVEPYTLVEQMVEVKRPSAAAPLTRDEFRAICDRESSVEDIVRALEAG